MKKEVEEFIKTWESEIAKIENRPIDSHGTFMIYNKYSMDENWLQLNMSEDENEKYYEVFHNIETKLTVALHSARSLYQLQNHSIWARIVEGIAALTYNKLPSKV